MDDLPTQGRRSAPRVLWQRRTVGTNRPERRRERASPAVALAVPIRVFWASSRSSARSTPTASPTTGSSTPSTRRSPSFVTASRRTCASSTRASANGCAPSRSTRSRFPCRASSAVTTTTIEPVPRKAQAARLRAELAIAAAELRSQHPGKQAVPIRSAACARPAEAISRTLATAVRVARWVSASIAYFSRSR
jgi:hypothetical protein